MITIDKSVLDTLTKEAKVAERFRMVLNFHTDYSDPMNRMLNAFESGT